MQGGQGQGVEQVRSATIQRSPGTDLLPRTWVMVRIVFSGLLHRSSFLGGCSNSFAAAPIACAQLSRLRDDQRAFVLSLRLRDVKAETMQAWGPNFGISATQPMPSLTHGLHCCCMQLRGPSRMLPMAPLIMWQAGTEWRAAHGMW